MLAIYLQFPNIFTVSYLNYIYNKINIYYHIYKNILSNTHLLFSKH